MSNLSIENEPNYAAQIIQVPKPFKLPNSDRLYGITVFGSLAIVDDSWVEKDGDLAVYFPAEVQLSEAFARTNNLHQHADLNDDPNEKGYLGDKRRVKALKLRGNVSSALVLPLESLVRVSGGANFSEGDRFDTINGVEISRKYKIKEPQVHNRQDSKIKKAFKRVDSTLLPEHIDTDQYLRNEGILDDNDILIVTQKLHGTSARFANTIVRRELKWWERWLVKAGVQVADTGYDTVAGSRKSIKDPHNPAQQHFYGEGGDVWTQYLERVESAIPKGYVVYGEIVGWINESPIQKGHTYDEPQGSNTLYVYRVATVNPDGVINDLSWDQVRKFCAERGLRTVPELWRGYKSEFDVTLYEELDFHSEYGKGLIGGVVPYFEAPVPLSKGGTGKDEGIAIRVERGDAIPLLFKFKNPSHYLYETAQLDSGEADIESEESA